MLDEHAARIRALNDQLRTGRSGGRIQITRGVFALGDNAIDLIWHKVSNFTDFSPGNDPYGEHDFGSILIGGIQIFWKIDYYDSSTEAHAIDPADEATCLRVLTIMLAEEY
jgi:hypothetical protein